MRALYLILGTMGSAVERVSRGVSVLTILGIVCSPLAAHAQYALSDADYGQVKRLLSRGKWQEAASTLEPMVRTTRGVPELSHDYARALFYLGKTGEALTVLRDAHEREPQARAQTQKLWSLLSRQFLNHEVAQEVQNALSLINERKLREAREPLKRAQDREPHNLEIWIRIAQTRVLEGDPRAALEPLKRAREINPFEPEVGVWMGRALFLTGLMGPAVEELTRARAQLPKSETAVLWLAEALAARGSRDEAIVLLTEDLNKEVYHLQSGLLAANYKLVGVTKKGPQSIAAQKLAQTVLSRIDEYEPKKHKSTESDLGLDLRNPSQLKTEAQALFQRIDALPVAEKP